MMSGMLVPVSAFEPVDKAAQAIATLFGVDPEFVTLCKTLWGPDVDPVEVWTDVFGKDNPTGPDMMTPAGNPSRKKRALEAAGIGATIIGGALGVKELKGSTRELRAAGKGRLWPAAKVGGVTAMLGGDAAATANQLSSRKKGVPGTKAARYDEVSKMPSVGALADGFEAGMRKLPGIGGLAPKARGAARGVKSGFRDAKSGQQALGGTTDRAYGAGQKLHSMSQSAAFKPPNLGPLTSTPGRRIATATAAGATGGVLVGMAARPKQPTAKRDSSLDVIWAGEFEKFDEDKRLVFGWASVVEVNGSPVVDRQGDYIHPDDLENASYEYVIKSRVGGDMHARDGDIPLKVSDLVESVVVTPEKLRHMGIPEHVAKTMPVGWWVGFKVHSDAHWDMVKKRARAGFSIHGRGKRVPTTMDQLMPGYH